MDKKDQDHKKDQDNKKDQDSEDNEDTDEKEYMYKDMEKKESKDMSLVKTMVSLVKKGDMNMFLILKERRVVAGGVGGVGVGGAHRVRQEADAPRPAPRAAQLRCPAAPSSCSPMRRTVDRPWLCWQRRVERGVV